MKKPLTFILLALLCINCKSQRIYYSNPQTIGLNNCTVIGESNKNLIVWQTQDQVTSPSEIMFFDNKMELIKTVKSDILKSDVNTNPEFIIDKDSLLVAYQSYLNNRWYYKLSTFDGTGNNFSTKVLDSADQTTSDSVLYFYKILQSHDKSIIAFAKIGGDKKNYLLRFDLSFKEDGFTAHHNFIIAFNDVHESLSDILLDNRKNILVVTCNRPDSANSFRIIQKNIDDDYMKVAAKKNDSGFISTNLLHIVETKNNYLIYGDWSDAKKQVH